MESREERGRQLTKGWFQSKVLCRVVRHTTANGWPLGDYCGHAYNFQVNNRDGKQIAWV